SRIPFESEAGFFPRACFPNYLPDPCSPTPRACFPNYLPDPYSFLILLWHAFRNGMEKAGIPGLRLLFGKHFLYTPSGSNP
ncbi:MAG: hypothetical protein V4710_17100, partial [Verrucomicrobiota bacterium]